MKLSFNKNKKDIKIMSKEIYSYSQDNRIDAGSVNLTPEEAAAISAEFVDMEGRLMSVEEVDHEALSRMKKLQEVREDPSATTNDVIHATNDFMEAASKKYRMELNDGRDPDFQHDLNNFYRGHAHHPGNKDKLHEAALAEASRAGVTIKTPKQYHSVIENTFETEGENKGLMKNTEFTKDFARLINKTYDEHGALEDSHKKELLDKQIDKHLRRGLTHTAVKSEYPSFDPTKLPHWVAADGGHIKSTNPQEPEEVKAITETAKRVTDEYDGLREKVS